MSKKLAIFDIDGTIFRSSLFIELLYELVEQGIFPKSVLKEIERDYLAWINRQGSYEVYAYKLVEIYRREIKGCREEDIKRASKIVFEKQRNKLYRFTRDLLKDLKKKGYFLLSISGSTQHVVESFTKHYGFDEYYSTTHEVKNGIFTGKEGGVQFRKLAIIKKFLSEHKEITLSGSVGVGDTESDIPFLNLVEKPIAFNPNRELARHAKRKKWRIVVERKDVIYDIQDFKMLNV